MLHCTADESTTEFHYFSIYHSHLLDLLLGQLANVHEKCTDERTHTHLFFLSLVVSPIVVVVAKLEPSSHHDPT